MELSFGCYSIGVRDIKKTFRVNIKPPFFGVVIRSTGVVAAFDVIDDLG